MKIIDGVKIHSFRNIAELELKNLKDFNIFIGPNNCGKTTILKALDILSKIKIGGPFLKKPACQCSRISGSWNNSPHNSKFLIEAGGATVSQQDKHMKKLQFTIAYSFNEKFITTIDNQKSSNGFFVELLQAIHGFPEMPSVKSEMEQHWLSLEKELTTLKLVQQGDTAAMIEHISLFSKKAITDKISANVVYIDDTRLQDYKHVAIVDYINHKDLNTTAQRELKDFIKEILDPQIKDIKHSLTLQFNGGFEELIINQGSGVRSLICLAVDILSAGFRSIILIDEPELGLNPHAKQEFLKFLFEQAQTKQIFIATHDPTFLNPLILDNKENYAIYVYTPLYKLPSSPQSCPGFIKVNLDESQEDPHVFCGYLPHTESLKANHLYVEGTKDVYAIQNALINYLQTKSGKSWLKLLNQISIHHMGGENWQHLLYTVLRLPYKTIILLDNDKLEKAKKICSAYSSISINSVKPIFCETIEEIRSALVKEVCPVYCLKTPTACVEDLDKQDGDDEQKKKILTEIEEIFSILANR